MKVILNTKPNNITISNLRPGDAFIDPVNGDGAVEIKVEYNDILFEFTGEEGNSFSYASVSLETGNVFFYENDIVVVPVNIVAREEGE